MRVHVLGSGTPKPSKTRANSSYLVEIGEDRILFDHGFGAGQRLLQLDIPVTTITHVFLSHHHYDHIGDLPRLLLTRWDQQRTGHRELEIFGPPPLGRIVDGLVGRDGAFACDLDARIASQCSRDLYMVRGGEGERRWPHPAVVELRPNNRIERNRWRVTTAEAIHCPERLSCLAYRIDFDGCSMVYSGDTGPSAGLARLAKGCDLLIHMCSQTSGRIATAAIAESVAGHMEVAEIAARAGAKMLVLTHIEHLEKPAEREEVLREISEIYDGEIVVAEDLMTFDLVAEIPIVDRTGVEIGAQ